MKLKFFVIHFRWYIKRNGPNTRVGKMREKFLEREKQYMIDTFMKKKNIDVKKIEKYWKNIGIDAKTHPEKLIEKLRSDEIEMYKYEKFNQTINEFVSITIRLHTQAGLLY